MGSTVRVDLRKHHERILFFGYLAPHLPFRLARTVHLRIFFRVSQPTLRAPPRKIKKTNPRRTQNSIVPKNSLGPDIRRHLSRKLQEQFESAQLPPSPSTLSVSKSCLARLLHHTIDAHAGHLVAETITCRINYFRNEQLSPKSVCAEKSPGHRYFHTKSRSGGPPERSPGRSTVSAASLRNPGRHKLKDAP